AGKPFTITVYTIGPSGCWRADGYELAIGGRKIEIKPYDVHSGADVGTGVLTFLPHVAAVTLKDPGAWTVRARGRRARHGDAVWEAPVAAERTILVRETRAPRAGWEPSARGGIAGSTMKLERGGATVADSR